MSSAGSTKNKPKKSSNLRILWIPGRKKHNRKGTYNPTKNGLPQTYGMQPRKNESWTLGGSMNHSKIINADLHENNIDVASIVTTAATGSAMAAMVTTNGPIAEQHDQLSLEPCPSTSSGKGQQSPQPQIVVGTIELNNLNGDVASNKQEKEIGTSNQFEPLTLIDEDDEDKDRNCSNAHSSSSLLSSNNDNRSTEENNLHNANTLSISEQHRSRNRRRSSQKDRRSAEDIDSIDQADSAVDVTHEEEPNVFDDEEEDAREKEHSASGANHIMTVHRRKNKLSRQRRSPVLPHRDVVDGEEERKEPYDKAVTCLYWSLACWDCNIS
ncbi:transcription initiation factor TFIID subunit 11 isoform X3 [Anopheles funestus]|uniref:transcription initiation factor TFIID subunit 11 isoform X3 n=1 Tax=Anopheles funestus TaxID=62324 RepID=UPI0020C70E7F|nr:transcription initiation factor TFIID subunit 11 isoform X3 [Anopheles funestus]